MTVGERIVALDEAAAALRAMADGRARCDSGELEVLAEMVGGAADRAQEVAGLRAVRAPAGSRNRSAQARGDVREGASAC